MGDPVQVGFGAGGASIDVNALVRWLKEKPVRLVAYRFLKLFEDHGILPTQIQRLIPEVTLEKITDPMTLLPALNNDVLDKTSKLFGVRRAWLEGAVEEVYPHRFCYQDPRRFFEQFLELSPPEVRWHRLIAFSNDPKLDQESGKRQTLVLVFVEHLCGWDDGNEIVRYRPLTEPWYWDYPKTRFQLKAMIRAAYDHLDVRVVPLIKVEQRVLSALEEGKAVPPDLMKQHGVSLEDYVLDSSESRVAKETDELDYVMKYIESLKIDEMAQKTAEKLRDRKRVNSAGLPLEAATDSTL